MISFLQGDRKSLQKGDRFSNQFPVWQGRAKTQRGIIPVTGGQKCEESSAIPKGVLSVIQTDMNTLSRGQKPIAGFVLGSYNRAVSMTASRLGRTVNVSESTVVRFAAELGYGGYPAIQRALQEMIRSKLTSIQRIEISNDRVGNQDIPSIVMQSNMDKIHAAPRETNQKDFDQATSAIMDVRHIYILGVRSAAALASLPGFYFNLIFDNVIVVHATPTNEVFEQLLRIGPNDVIMGVSSPRHSRRTVEATQFVHDRRVATIALTGNGIFPLTPISTLTLLAGSDMASFVDSLMAPLSLINALIVTIGRKKNDDPSQIFEALEQIWDEYEVYGKVEEIT